jgi:hypothetical protein
MITKFINQKEKNILICIVDNTSINLSDKAREVSKNLTDYFINVGKSKGFDIWIGSDENELLKESANENFYKYSVLIASGTSLGNNRNLFNEIELLCKNDFSIAGHILDRKENYYELHHQFYIVNCKDYRDLNFPVVGNFIKESHYQIEPKRSKENVHDDYVPLFISQGTTSKQYSEKWHGWNIISVFLSHNKKIIDIGNGIRKSKSYLYYEYDHVFLKVLPEIYHQQLLVSYAVPAENTDNFFKDVNFQGPVEQYITVGTGYHWTKNLISLGFNKDTKITFTDCNYNILRFMKKMIDEWNGENYISFYRDFLNETDFKTKKFNNEYFEQVTQNWNSFRQSIEDWDHYWYQIKNLNYDFRLINYLSSYDLDWVEKDKKTIFNVSNIFNFSANVFENSVKYRVACENRLISRLHEIDNKIFLIFSERAADVFIDHSTFQNTVENYVLTDINNLKKTPWHYNDWQSPKILL